MESLLATLWLPQQQSLAHLIPYAIIIINCILFKLMRSLVDRLFKQTDQNEDQANNKASASMTTSKNYVRLLKLFFDEIISTSELCADCAELNVVYEKHGSYAYGLSLFILTYIWMDSFGDAHTTPGYLAEDYFLVSGNQLLKRGDTYARFIGQSMAMPLAWRFASFYWRYHLLSEHSNLLVTENCKSSLSTSVWNGFLIEFTCCLICRLAELVGHKLLEKDQLSQRMVSLLCSFLCSLLVVMALELSGGYFNPVLAASLEYGCQGIDKQQHALVFWLAPLIGHVSARALFKRFNDGGQQNTLIWWAWPSTGNQQPNDESAERTINNKNNQQASSATRRQTRSTSGASQRRKKSDKID